MDEPTALATIAELAHTLGPGIEVAATLRPPLVPGEATWLGSAPALEGEIELGAPIGRGGMGEVLLARQRSLEREVAVKRLLGDAWTPATAAALVHEARTMGGLEHPSIVPVHALGRGPEGAPLLVMRRIEGASLQELLDDEAHPAWAALERRDGDRLLACVEILARVTDALELAHARGIVHRDVKPANVMVGPYGETWLLDWGIAVAPAGLPPAERERAALAGTPAYMAPEMVTGKVSALDARTDVYLLGATLHAVLTGAPRHAGTTLERVLVAACLSEPAEYGDDVPAELAALAREATAARPADRVPDVTVFRDRLLGYRRHRASLALTERIEETLARLGEPSHEDLALPETSRALTEARFGLAHALAEWPQNEAAKTALARTLRLQVEVELARGSPETAAALLDELPGIDPDLARRVETLRAEAREHRDLADRARADALERDPGVRGRERAVFLVAGLAASAALSLGFYVAMRGASPFLEALVSDAVQLAAIAALIAVFRKRALVNRWARSLVVLLLAVGGLMMVVTGATWLRGGTIEEATALRNLAFAAAFAGAAIQLSPRLWIPAAWGAVATLVGSRWPDLANPATFVTLLLGVGTIAWESLRAARREP